jgi:NhaP-type Na+/H+ and K+/H+ antiporter
MAWVGLRGAANTLRAVVPVGTGQTFVANTDDTLTVYISLRANLNSTAD